VPPPAFTMLDPALAARNLPGVTDKPLSSGLVLSGPGPGPGGGGGGGGGVVTGTVLNVATTVLLAVMLIVQVAPLGVSQPVQPVNVEPVAALAVRTTDVPSA